jgi:small subunit ribosomal protein S9
LLTSSRRKLAVAGLATTPPAPQRPPSRGVRSTNPTLLEFFPRQAPKRPVVALARAKQSLLRKTMDVSPAPETPLTSTKLAFTPANVNVPMRLYPVTTDVARFRDVFLLSPLAKMERATRELRAPRPPVEPRVVHVNEKTQSAEGSGKRKTALAFVRLTPCEDEFVGADMKVNDVPFGDYFMFNDEWMLKVIEVLQVTNMLGKVHLHANVRGGGHGGQSGAMRLATAKALQSMNPDWRAELKRRGMLTSDWRNVERKKPGQKKARKKFAFVKR